MAISEKHKKIITDLGLSPNETGVYLATLKLGPTTVLQIAKESGMYRPTIYAAIETLKQKGLMRIDVHGFKKKFVAESPDKIEKVLEEKRNKFLEILPEITAQYNLRGQESDIKFYEGLEGIKSIYESMIRDIKPHEDYMVISDTEKWYHLDPNFFQDFIERRAKLNINIRLLLQEGKTSREHKKFEKNYNEKIKILPKGTDLPTNLIIIPQRALIHQLVPPMVATVIENKSTIQTFQQLFEIIWASIPGNN